MAAKVCKFWKQGRCTHGSSCRYRHVGPSGGNGGGNQNNNNGQQKKLCKQWKKKGKCSYGSNCRFRHDTNNMNMMNVNSNNGGFNGFSGGSQVVQMGGTREFLGQKVIDSVCAF